MKIILIFSHFSFFLFLTVVTVLLHISPVMASPDRPSCRPPLSNEYCVQQKKPEYNPAKKIIRNFWQRMNNVVQNFYLGQQPLSPEKINRERRAFTQNKNQIDRKKNQVLLKLKIDKIQKMIESQPEISVISDPNIQEDDFSLPDIEVTPFRFADLKPLSSPRVGSSQAISPQAGTLSGKNEIPNSKLSQYKIPQHLILAKGLSLNAVQRWQTPLVEEPLLNLRPYSQLDLDYVDHLIGQILIKKQSCHLATGFLLEGTGDMISCLFDLGFHLQSLEQLELYFKKWHGSSPHTKTKLDATVKKALKKWAQKSPRSLREKLGELLSQYQIEYPNKDLRSRSGYLQALFHLGKDQEKKAIAAAKMVDSKSNLFGRAKIIQLVLGAKPKRAFKELLKFDLSRLNQSEKGLIHTVLASIEFERSNFKKTSALLRAINEKDPAWIQSLLKLGWSQLLSEDYFGAIGNMHSLHTPLFKNLYLPESYVVRTIGYLGICQYGDAYRTLTQLEDKYRPVLARVKDFLKTKKNPLEYNQALENFLSSNATRETAPSSLLPKRVLLEVSRQKDVMIMQKLILQIEKEIRQYTFIENLISSEIAKLIPPQKGIKKKWLKHQLLSQAFANIKSRNQKTETRINTLSNLLRKRTGKAAKKHLLRIKKHLTTLLDNNEILRFEVFSNSGENLRQISSQSLKTKRVHRNTKPRKKNLQWSVNDEIWLDEIGHYRSSLKNSCARKTTTAKREN